MNKLEGLVLAAGIACGLGFAVNKFDAIDSSSQAKDAYLSGYTQQGDALTSQASSNSETGDVFEFGWVLAAVGVYTLDTERNSRRKLMQPKEEPTSTF